MAKVAELTAPLKEFDRYSVKETRRKVHVCIPIPEGEERPFILEKDAERSEICGYFDPDFQIFCGKTWKPFVDAQVIQYEDKVEIIIEKAESIKWDVLFSGCSSKGIDGQSAFNLAVFFAKDAEDRSKSYLDTSIRSGYIPAIVYKVSQVVTNVDEKIELLLSVPPIRRSEEIYTLLYDAYKTKAGLEHYRTLLEADSTRNSHAKLALAILLSPYSGELPSPDASYSLLRELTNDECPRAMYLLAKHLADGCGCKVDRSAAREYLDRAIELDSTLEVFDIPEDEQIVPDEVPSKRVRGISKLAIIGLGATGIAVITTAFFIYHHMKASF